MKYPLIIVAICTLGIMFFSFFKKKEKQSSTVFQVTQHQAPDDLLEYPPAGGENHGEGLYSRVISPATNNRPMRAYDIVHLKYKLWNTSGKNVDSSDRRYHLLKLRVDGGGSSSKVIKGWQKMLPYLKEGETRRVWIPEALAYPNSTNEATQGRLVFDMTVVKVDRPILPPEFDAFPTEPSDVALSHPSGLTSLKTQPITTDSVTPSPSDVVEIHLNMWSKDGSLFSSTEKMNRHLQLSLALPQGDYIADIELLAISPKIEDVSSHLLK